MGVHPTLGEYFLEEGKEEKSPARSYLREWERWKCGGVLLIMERGKASFGMGDREHSGCRNKRNRGGAAILEKIPLSKRAPGRKARQERKSIAT